MSAMNQRTQMICNFTVFSGHFYGPRAHCFALSARLKSFSVHFLPNTLVLETDRSTKKQTYMPDYRIFPQFKALSDFVSGFCRPFSYCFAYDSHFQVTFRELHVWVLRAIFRKFQGYALLNFWTTVAHLRY